MNCLGLELNSDNNKSDKPLAFNRFLDLSRIQLFEGLNFGNKLAAFIGFLFLLGISTSAFAGQNGNSSNDSFSKSKRLLSDFVYKNPQDMDEFYCGMKFDENGKIIDFNGFKLEYKGKSSRKKDVSGFIQWDHVVPAENFGKSFEEWRSGSKLKCWDIDIGLTGIDFEFYKGRKCAGELSGEYKFMESDMYNLVPANGYINVMRGNTKFGMVEGEDRKFGKCDLELTNVDKDTDKDGRRIEPRPEVRGDIARIYFYMDWAYPGHGILSDQSKKLFEVWNKQDPISYQEVRRTKLIESIQGNENPFVKGPAIQSGLRDEVVIDEPEVKKRKKKK